MSPEMQALQDKFDALVTQATANTDAESAAVTLIGQLGVIVVAAAGDKAVTIAIGEAMQNKTGELKSSADALAAAIVAGTPAA
jgi:hypothetical protein